MAQGKKSFIAYSDWKDTFDAIPNEQAGILIKHIFSYVNDENPKTDDILVNAVFQSIKNSLKRDLKKWDKQYEQRVEAGKRSAEVRKRNSTLVNARSISSTVSDSVSVTDSVSEKEKKKEKRFNFRKSLIDYGFNEILVNDWLLVRKKLKATNSETAFKIFIKEIELNGSDKNIILTECVSRSWKGFKSDWFKVVKKNKGYRI